jgi:hypothetical protein
MTADNREGEPRYCLVCGAPEDEVDPDAGGWSTCPLLDDWLDGQEPEDDWERLNCLDDLLADEEGARWAAGKATEERRRFAIDSAGARDAAAEALLVLGEMAIERGVVRLADLGNLPPLDAATKAKYLARARARAGEAAGGSTGS